MNKMKKRVLFFTPYTPWTPHLMWEVTIAYALRQRGHKVRFVTCSGLPDCGMSPARGERERACCQGCRDITRTLATTLRQNVEFMQAEVTPQQLEEIRCWVDGLDVEELPTAVRDGLPFGEWTRADMITYWHTNELRLDQPDV